jgi:hypothetical protein
MSARIEVELTNGSKVLFGKREAAGRSSEVPSRVETANVTAYTFKIALGSLAEVVEMLEHAVASMANRPEKVEMEFGASLSSECNLWIMPGAGDAEFRVKLTWGRDSIKSGEGQHK